MVRAAYLPPTDKKEKKKWEQTNRPSISKLFFKKNTPKRLKW